MNNQDMCSVIMDLLPLYVDKLTSEETNTIIENHIEVCSICKKEYQILKSGENDVTHIPQNNVPIKEIDYLKKIKKYQNITTLLGAIISFFLGACLPPASLLISSIIKGGISDYHLARLQLTWNIVLLKMFILGLLFCCFYLFITFIIKKSISKKEK